MATAIYSIWQREEIRSKWERPTQACLAENRGIQNQRNIVDERKVKVNWFDIKMLGASRPNMKAATTASQIRLMRWRRRTFGAIPVAGNNLRSRHIAPAAPPRVGFWERLRRRIRGEK